MIFSRWVDAKKKLPKKTGNYLVSSVCGYCTALHYSSKHKLFNAWDFDNEKEAKENAILVLYWRTIPKLPKDCK